MPPPVGLPGEVNVFVAERGNAFMRDIADWLVEAAALTGRDAKLVSDRLPVDDGATNLVVAPHEFYVLRDDTDADIRRAARCSVPICTEQPGTPWFLLSLGFCVGSPLVVDINALGAEAVAAEGFDVHRLGLGAVPSMDHRRRPAVERDIDVVFLGGATDRRARGLAQLAPVLWDRHSQIRLFTFSRPISGDEPGVVFGQDKYELLARSKVLVNLHRGDDGHADYFEWARMVEAMANGCVVVTEPSRGYEPLVAGEHFVEVESERLVDAVCGLLDDPLRRVAIADAAHRAVVDDQPMVTGVAELLDRIDAAPAVAVHSRWRSARAHRRLIVRAHAPPLLPVFEPYRALRRDVYDQLLAEIAHRRELGQLRSLIEFGAPDHVAHTASSAWDAASQAEVSVVVTLYNYADVVVETLDSVASSLDVNTEIVIVDDHSADGGVAVVKQWMAAHDDIPVLLLESAVNRGLVRARNLAIEQARTDKVMVMDADNLVYPTCLRRLSDALDRDPTASFAYATLEAFGPDPGLRSAQGWFVPWLCERNYIDAQAMIRHDVLVRHDGYRVDDAMYGWEDWDLWLRLAVAGEFGVHVPEMLGRYRTQPASMVSLTNLAADDLRADLRTRYPSLPWP